MQVWLILSPFDCSEQCLEIRDHKARCKGGAEAFILGLHSLLIQGSGAALSDWEGLQIMAH